MTGLRTLIRLPVDNERVTIGTCTSPVAGFFMGIALRHPLFPVEIAQTVYTLGPQRARGFFMSGVDAGRT